MDVKDFAEIEEEFHKRVFKMVWCAVASVDGQGRPRSRILHPIWEGCTGWIGTFRNSHKSRHLARNPYLSLAYITDIWNPVYVDAAAEWVDDLAQKQRIWEMFKNAPEPMGYDPALTFGSYDHENFGLLKLTPWRIALITFPAPSHHEGERVWRNGEKGLEIGD